MCLTVLPVCMYVRYTYVWYLCFNEEDVGSPRIGAIDDCKPSCEY